MSQIRGHDEIRDAYRDDRVARRYVDERFREPIGALLHARQTAALTRVIRTHAPKRVLEIAPGPARLTVEVAKLVSRGVVMDASAQMLGEARRRLKSIGAENWRFVQGDAFQLPLRGAFDLVYTFRLIRHFDADDRRRLYAQAHALLPPGGLLVFDAVNELISAPIRANSTPEEYQHYDALFLRDALIAELAAAGFEALQLDAAQRRFAILAKLQVLVAPRSRSLARIAMEAVDRVGGGEPLEWIVTCRRR